MTADPRTARRVARHWPWISGGIALALALSLGALVALRSRPYGFDEEWLDELIEERSPFWTVLAMLMNFFGGGWFSVFVVPIVLAVLFLVRRRPWSALFSVLALAASAGTVQVLKSLFGRARPEAMLVHSDFGSFPSGHVANAATLAVVLALVFARWWVWAAGAAYVLLMALSRTYLGVHWLSDTVGGALVGAAIAVLLWTPLAAKLQAENRVGGASPPPPRARDPRSRAHLENVADDSVAP